MNHVMIDLETLGTRPGCVILSIGAVRFCPETKRIGQTFYRNISVEDSRLYHFQEDPKTVQWWSQQAPKVRDRLLDNPVSVRAALTELDEFLCNESGHRDRDLQVWCQGGSFDFPILSAAYDRLQMTQPWDFWNERDSRTFLQVAKQTTGFMPTKLATGAHDALADATHQAREVMRAWQLLCGLKRLSVGV